MTCVGFMKVMCVRLRHWVRPSIENKFLKKTWSRLGFGRHVFCVAIISYNNVCRLWLIGFISFQQHVLQDQHNSPGAQTSQVSWILLNSCFMCSKVATADNSSEFVNPMSSSLTYHSIVDRVSERERDGVVNWCLRVLSAFVSGDELSLTDYRYECFSYKKCRECIGLASTEGSTSSNSQFLGLKWPTLYEVLVMHQRFIVLAQVYRA